MAREKENLNPRSNFQVETIIGRLDKMHYIFLKEVEEMKDSLVNMARAFDQVEQQCAEVELKMQRKDAEVELKMLRKDEQLLRAEKKIEDLSKENEQLKKKCLKRCEVELKRMPLMEIQRKKNCTRNCAETVDRPQQVKDVASAPQIGQHNDGDCELALQASNPVVSTEVIVPESTDYLPACKAEGQVFHGNETCSTESNRQQLSVPSGPEFPSVTIQEFTLEGNFDIPVKASSSAIPAGEIIPEFIDYLPVYKSEDQVFQGNEACSVARSKPHSRMVQELSSVDNSVRLELAGPSTDVLTSSEDLQEQESMEELPVQRIKEEQFDDEGIIQLADTDDSSTVDFRPEHSLNEEGEWTSTVPMEGPSETSNVMTVYHCDICPAHLDSWTLLQSHKKGHGDRTGLKRHKCTECFYVTDHSQNLKHHMRTHTKERPHRCAECHRTFAQSTDLQKHFRTHTKERPYVCEVCHKGFALSNGLRKHMWTHANEKPYKCNVCHRAFTQSGNLHRHMRTHTKEKPFVCNVCQRAFTQRHHLRDHVERSHTKEESQAISVLYASH